MLQQGASHISMIKLRLLKNKSCHKPLTISSVETAYMYYAELLTMLNSSVCNCQDLDSNKDKENANLFTLLTTAPHDLYYIP